MSRREPAPTQVCPHCGASFPRGRLACPECGSDESTGWKSQEEIDYESVEIPDHWPEEPVRGGPLPRWLLLAAAVAALIAFALLFVFRG